MENKTTYTYFNEFMQTLKELNKVYSITETISKEEIDYILLQKSIVVIHEGDCFYGLIKLVNTNTDKNLLITEYYKNQKPIKDLEFYAIYLDYTRTYEIDKASQEFINRNNEIVNLFNKNINQQCSICTHCSQCKGGF